MKSLIEQFVTWKVLEYGGIEVETPIMYDTKHPSMEKAISIDFLLDNITYYQITKLTLCVCSLFWSIFNG